MVATNETMAFTYLTDLVTHTFVFSKDYIISLIALILVLVLITREVKKWKVLALPVYVALKVVGFNTSWIIWVIVTIMFVIEAMSLEVLGELITAIAKRTPVVGKAIEVQKLSKQKRNADEKAQQKAFFEESKRNKLAELKTVKELKEEKERKKEILEIEKKRKETEEKKENENRERKIQLNKLGRMLEKSRGKRMAERERLRMIEEQQKKNKK